MAGLDTSTYDDLLQAIDDAPLETEADVEAFHIQFLSKKQGRVTALLRGFSDVPPDERAAYGQQVNHLKQHAEERLTEAREALAAQRRADEQEALDLTLPGRRPFAGSEHPLTQTLEEIKQIAARFGFGTAEGPEV